MAKKELILQRLTTSTHIDAVRRLFDIDEIQKVLLGVAFITENGVEKIEDKLKAHAAHLTVFAGIRNGTTSYQALVRLHGIGGSLYTVDAGPWGVIFHPKIFLARGYARARVVMGSANLTLGGLNNNIEAGILLDLDLTDIDDYAFVDEIEAQFDALQEEHPDNVMKVSKLAELDEMLASGRLVDELAVPPPDVFSWGSASDTVPRIKLKGQFLQSTLAKAKATPKIRDAASSTSAAASRTATTAEAELASADNASPTFEQEYESVWLSNPLSRRSLTIPTGSNSHPTGSTTLSKGRSYIDPVTYFRDDIFGHLRWQKYTNRAGNSAEFANAEFDLYVKGKLEGTFTLTLRHSSTRVAAAVFDKNVPTELSWNDARHYITRRDLIGLTMTLYRNINDPKRFAITID
jgi:HKD family nuclease